MDIIINGEKVQPSPQSNTVGDALNEFSGSFKGMLITSVLLDGQELAQQQLDDTTDLPIAQSGRLEIHMESTAVLAAEALDHAADVLATDRRSYVQVATEINVSGLEAATQTLSDFFTNWVSVQNALNQAASAIGVSIDQLSQLWQLNIIDMIKQMTETLGQLQQALKKSDSVAVADLLEYELAGTADSWIDTLTVLSRKFRTL